MDNKTRTHAIEFCGNEFRQVVCDQSGNGHHIYGKWRSGGDVINQIFDALLRSSSMSVSDGEIVLKMDDGIRD